MLGLLRATQLCMYSIRCMGQGSPITANHIFIYLMENRDHELYCTAYSVKVYTVTKSFVSNFSKKCKLFRSTERF